MRTQLTKSRARQLLEKAGGTALRRVRRLVDGPDAADSGRRRPGVRPSLHAVAALRASGAHLSPADALHENGFTVFRGLFTAQECAQLAAALKGEAGIKHAEKYTKVDATNSFATARQVLLEGRMLDAVRSAVGPDARFLQVSDLHYLHDTAGWHRDSVHRAPDASEAPDWSDVGNPFGVVKAILYLESDNAAMGMMAGSHRSPVEMDHLFVKAVERAGGQLVIDAREDPNRRFSEADKRIPLAWPAQVGDVLVFDERMYHAGRRVQDGQVNSNRAAPKFVLSLVFGVDNHHSERMYSYFRYARTELNYRDLPEDFTAELASRGLVLSHGWTNFYAEHPRELRHVHLPNPTRLTALIEEFSKTGP